MGPAPSEFTNNDVCVELVWAGSPETVLHKWYPQMGRTATS